MAAIITPKFRIDNVQNMLNEMTDYQVMLYNVASSGTTISTAGGAALDPDVRVGMKIVVTTATSGAISRTVPNLVTAVGTNSFTVQTAPSPALVGATLGFFHQYYVGIGKGDPYAGTLDGSDSAPGVPLACPRTEVDCRNNLIALKRVVASASTSSLATYGDAGFVVPRYSWTTGNFYKAWDPTDPTCFYPTTGTYNGNSVTLYPCYATYGTKVFVCAASGYDAATKTPSGNAPTGTVLGTVSATDASFYKWVYVSDIGLDESTIATPTGSTVASLDSNQYFKIYSNTSESGAVILPTASSGSVNSIRILAGGTGYTSGTFRVDGDGNSVSTASGTFVASGGAITSMTVTASGAGYTSGTVTIVTGTGSGSVLLPRIAPKNGFGFNVTYDLPAWFAGFYASFPYDANGDIPTGDSIRQVSLIRDAVVTDSNANGIYGCLKTMTFTTSAAIDGGYILVPGDVIEDAVNGARAFVDNVNGAVVKYHQNSSQFGTSPIRQMNTLPFGTGVTHKVNVYSAAAAYAYQAQSTNAIASLAAPTEYVPGTGDVVFVEQRAPISQNASQSEAVSIILQF